MEVREGGGGGWVGGGKWSVGAQNSVSLAALPKKQSLVEIGFHGTLFLSSTFLLKFLIDFSLSTWQSM